MDTSTLQILKDHGIAMLEDTDDTLLNSALQSGRRLVLSGAGKLILNDPKYKPLMTATTSTATRPALPLAGSSTSPGKKTIYVPAATLAAANAAHPSAVGLANGNATANQIRFEALRKKTIFMPSKSTIGGGSGQHAKTLTAMTARAAMPTMPLKTNKVIKILTAEEFKEMCGAKAAAGSTLKKISTDTFHKGELK